MSPSVALLRRNHGPANMVNLEAEQFRAILRRELPTLAARYCVASLGLFGSYVRRENRPDSDLDVLVSFTDLPGLFRFVELEDYLSDLLGVKVDLVMRDALKPRIGQRILSEVVPV
jgi:predicted nucleotidyltransferase